MQYGPVSLLIRGHLHKKSSPLEMWLSFVVQLPCGSTRDGQAQRSQSHIKAKQMCVHSASLLIRGHLHKKSSPLEMWLSFVVQLPCGCLRALRV